MLSLIKSRLREIRSALWFRPTAYSLAMLGLAVVLAVADGHLPEPMVRWLPDIGVPVVENLLRLLASSMLTVTTVTLSVLILVLSLAAGQASPRTVPELMADPPTQRALGTFLGSFVFSLSALVFLGVEAITGPGVALTFAVALLLVASALRHLVQWIHHVSDALKLNRVIERVHRQSHAVLDRYLDPATDSESDGDDDGTEPDGADRFPVHPHRAGYVQFIDAEALGRLAGRHDLRLRLAVGEGAFVQPRVPVMDVAGGDGDDEALKGSLAAAVVVGADRSPAGDPLLGFELLAEIACRALSPGLNDPQTALVCIDYLSSLLGRAAAVAPDDYPGAWVGGGRVRLVRPSFERMLRRAVRPLARDGAGNAEVMLALLQALAAVADTADPSYGALIRAEAGRVEAQGLDGLTLPADREDLRAAAARLA